MIAGLTALATAVVIGVAIDPSAAASNGAQAAVTSGSGQVVRVQVTAAAMRFVPAQVHVHRGVQLVVELTNADTTTHDLMIGQASTGRMAPGALAELDAGVMGQLRPGVVLDSRAPADGHGFRRHRRRRPHAVRRRDISATTAAGAHDAMPTASDAPSAMTRAPVDATLPPLGSCPGCTR